MKVEPLVEMKGIRKNFGAVQALKGVDLTVHSGDFTAIVGSSGSGKTTLLNIIGCVDHATSGSVRIGGEEVIRMNDKKLTDLRLYKIGFIFQTFNLIPVLNIRENVEFPLLLMKGMKKAEIKRRTRELIEDVGSADFVKHRPSELSGGQALGTSANSRSARMATGRAKPLWSAGGLPESICRACRDQLRLGAREITAWPHGPHGGAHPERHRPAAGRTATRAYAAGETVRPDVSWPGRPERGERPG